MPVVDPLGKRRPHSPSTDFTTENLSRALVRWVVRFFSIITRIVVAIVFIIMIIIVPIIMTSVISNNDAYDNSHNSREVEFSSKDFHEVHQEPGSSEGAV